MCRAGVDTIIFSSTCATYGEVTKLPLDEETLQAPINPYGQTKLMNEQLLKDYGKAYGLRWAAMRYFNAAGADPDGEIGESHSPESHAIPLAIMAALGTGPEFRVFGDDYETPDGSALRDYIHVTDLADAHVKALTYLQNGGTSTAFNLGTGVPTSVFDIIAAIQAVAGKPVPYQKVERRLGDPAALYASPQKARTVLGWEPKHSHIDSIVNSAVRWHQNPAF
jgi:UDP-arabinose 4-epimerase